MSSHDKTDRRIAEGCGYTEVHMHGCELVGFRSDSGVVKIPVAIPLYHLNANAALEAARVIVGCGFDLSYDLSYDAWTKDLSKRLWFASVKEQEYLADTAPLALTAMIEAVLYERAAK